jgi:hypothetical protein
MRPVERHLDAHELAGVMATHDQHVGFGRILGLRIIGDLQRPDVAALEAVADRFHPAQGRKPRLQRLEIGDRLVIGVVEPEIERSESVGRPLVDVGIDGRNR